MLHVKLKNRIPQTTIRPKNKQTNKSNKQTNQQKKKKKKTDRHSPIRNQRKMEMGWRIAGMKDGSWTIRSSEWQIKGVRSAGRDVIVRQQGVTWAKEQ